jgi:hypothetical protein
MKIHMLLFFTGMIAMLYIPVGFARNKNTTKHFVTKHSLTKHGISNHKKHETTSQQHSQKHVKPKIAEHIPVTVQSKPKKKPTKVTKTVMVSHKKPKKKKTLL